MDADGNIPAAQVEIPAIWKDTAGMSEIIEWHDLVRKSFNSVEEAQSAKTSAMRIIEQCSIGVFKRKLFDGFDIVEPLRREWIRLVHVIECENPEYFAPGKVYLEARYVAKIRESEIKPQAGWKLFHIAEEDRRFLCHADKPWWMGPNGNMVCATCHPTPWDDDISEYSKPPEDV